MDALSPRPEAPINTVLIQPVQPDLLTIASTPITESIPDSVLKKALQTPPFVAIPGALNLRDLGLLPNPKIKPGLIYRSGSLHPLPQSSIPLLKSKLRLSAIYDLRDVHERARAPDPEIHDVEQIWVPTPGAALRAVPADFMGDGGVKGYQKMYDDILKVYASSYKKVLEYLRDELDKPILFHCSGNSTFSSLSYLSNGSELMVSLRVKPERIAPVCSQLSSYLSSAIPPKK
jgi:hypothetical protein